jgi:hypothetical protein
MRTVSWVIIETATGRAVLETYQKSITEKVNTDKYLVIPILLYLQNLNKNYGINKL